MCTCAVSLPFTPHTNVFYRQVSVTKCWSTECVEFSVCEKQEKCRMTRVWVQNRKVSIVYFFRHSLIIKHSERTVVAYLKIVSDINLQVLRKITLPLPAILDSNLNTNQWWPVTAQNGPWWGGCSDCYFLWRVFYSNIKNCKMLIRFLCACLMHKVISRTFSNLMCKK